MVRGFLVLTALLVIAPRSAFAFSVPANDGFVTDTIHLLTAEQERTLEDRLRAYRDRTSNEIAILIVQSLLGEPIAESAVQVGRAWGVGGAERDNGILVLIAHADREIFIATGYGLEGAVPDAVAKGIVEEVILPSFRDGEYYAGVVAGLDALERHIAGEYTADRYAHGNEAEGSGFLTFILFLAFLLFDFVAAFLARSKAWWAGGIVGFLLSLVIVWLTAFWLAIPVLVVLGLLFDYIVSKHPPRRGYRHGGYWGGGFGGRGGGGFGGFGGGSFGGGGARGRW